MSRRDTYMPGPATGASVDETGGAWVLVLVRELRHAPEMVWEALTDPAQLAEWAPFDADRNLATPGPAKLVTVGAPQAPSECVVRRAVAPKLLELQWGGREMRWELEPHGQGTRLTLWHDIGRDYIAWGAAGWHICIDVLDGYLAHEPIGRMVGPETMQHEGWQRLVKEYRAQLGAAS